MDSSSCGAMGSALFAIAPALLFGLASLRVSSAVPFRTASRAGAVSTVLALALGVVSALRPPTPRGELDVSPLARGLIGLVRVDWLTSVMLGLVSALALVIIRYSRSYLRGEAGGARYERALLSTLACVSTIVVSNNLLAIGFAWMGASFALHRLLTFYRERPQALVAAHKKFLLSRIADGCTLGAVVLIGRAAGSVDLDVVNAWARSSGASEPSLQVAAVLLVAGVALKSAQLPFHGWLTQVMEAPTPVSALLHAGIVNIGGFLMIRMAPFMAQASIAQTLLVVIGTTTATIASLVMTTRVSVKVALAWSTCAQMGFMLVECGLGAWHFALLHLVAHSVYKAHAFLGSGSAVDLWRAEAMAPRPTPPSVAHGVAAPALIVLAVLGTAALVSRLVPTSGSLDEPFAPLVVVFGLSVAPWAIRGARGEWRLLARVVGIATLYFAWHALSLLLVRSPLDSGVTSVRGVVVISGFGALFVTEAILRSQPRGRIARALQPRLFAGLHLDELFTRMTFRIWPPPFASEGRPPPDSMRSVRSQEARP